MITDHYRRRTGRSLLTALLAVLSLMAALLPGLAPAAAVETHDLHIDDAAPVNEGDDGDTLQLAFTVRLEPAVPPAQEVTFTWSTVDGTATDGLDDTDREQQDSSEDTDYVAVTGKQDSIPATETETTILVELVGDGTIEPDETLTVTIDSVQNATQGGDGTAEGAIVNDDPKVSVADPAPVVEGETASLTVMLTPPAETTTTVTYRTTDSSDEPEYQATADVDYDRAGDGETDEAVLIRAGEDQTTIPVDTFQDETAENDERFVVELTGSDNAFFDDDDPESRTATVTILDDEPRVWISDVTQQEGHSGYSDFVFEVHVDPPTSEEVVVDFATDDSEGNATERDGDNDYDYIGTSGQLTFPDDSTAVQTVTVQVKGDTSAEETNQQGQVDETFHVVLDWPGPDNAPNVSLDDSGLGTIVGDDNPRVSIVDHQAFEGGEGETPTLGVPVTLEDEDGDPLSTGKDIVLEYWTTTGGEAGTATEDIDYEHIASDSPATVTIPAGASSGTLPVTVIGDDVEEDDETFTVEFDEPTDNDNPDLTLGSTSAVATIEDDEGLTTITVGDTDKVEGDAFERFMEFPVSLSHPSDFEVTVGFNTRDGTAQDENADGDYQSKAGTITFEPGETDRIVAITVYGDTKPEADETLVLRLRDASNGTFPEGDRTEATGTIINDDGPGISVADVTVEEGDSGTTDALFAVTADTTDHDGFTVDVATADGTATAGSDYTAFETTTLTFEPEQATAAVAVPVHGDTDHEDDETFLLQLSNPSYAVITDGEGVATITNDDEAPPTDDGRSDDDGTTADGGSDDGTTDDGGTDGTGDDGPDIAEITRSAGATRIETALQVSRDHWDQAPDVVLANAATFPDALAGGALSALLDAPLLLTFPDQLSDGVAAEFDRLGAQSIWILGGPAAISPHIQHDLTNAGFEIHRFFGQDRFETAAAIARGTGPSQAGEVVLALGAHEDDNRAWPDALAAGALAAVPDPLPVLLTLSDALPQATESALADLQVQTVYVLGGSAAISQGVEDHLGGLGYEIVRLAGASRYGTSVAAATEALSRHGDAGAEHVVFATGQNFPDGLAAGALAARLNGLLLLVPSDQLAEESNKFLAANAERLDYGVIVGGGQALGADIAREVGDALLAGG